MTPPVSEYAGLPFDLALGEVYGLRTWRVDYYGRLRSLHVTTSGAWRPGVNEATCHKSDYASGGFIFPSSFLSTVYGSISSITAEATPTPKPEEPKEPEPEPEPPHLTPVEGCACGFYAYTDARHEEVSYRREGYVTGIVRGTGRTLIGTKGFRCEKAEIIALLDPTRGGKKSAPWRGEQAAKLVRVYPDVPLLPSRSALLGFAPIEPTLPEPGSDEFWSLP